ncbi:MAG: pyridoxal phosphate-dependent aminotransferase [Candidatus Binataceae bacterium]
MAIGSQPSALIPIPADATHGGGAPDGTLDFSVSLNPLGPPPAVFEAYGAAADAIANYPAPYASRLTAAIARWAGVEAVNVLVGNGSTQLIHLLARTLEAPAMHVVIPTFSEIANAIAIAGKVAYPITLDEHDFTLTEEKIATSLARQAGPVFIGRPNSPTGSMLSLAQANVIVRLCRRFNVYCVFDEAFIDFVEDGKSCASILRSLPNLVVLRSLTKIFSIAGLRLGFVIAAEPIVTTMRARLEPWSVNAIAERVALACLEDAGEFIARSQALVSRERMRIETRLRALGLRVIPSAANFLMVDLRRDEGGISTADGFISFMMSRGIFVRDLRRLPGCVAGMFRVGIRTPADNDVLLGAIEAWIKTR